MRALQFTTYGGPEALEWTEAPDPHAGPGQIRVAVRAASVNPLDWKVLAGSLSGGQPLAGPGISVSTPQAWWTRSARGHRDLRR